ncbi:MAG: DUF3309 family protein [Nitrospirota bacterium]
MSTIIIVVLGVLCVGVLPIWPYSGTWGYIRQRWAGFPPRGPHSSDSDGSAGSSGNCKAVVGMSARS